MRERVRVRGMARRAGADRLRELLLQQDRGLLALEQRRRARVQVDVELGARRDLCARLGVAGYGAPGL
jgi:hypothetical protein